MSALGDSFDPLGEHLQDPYPFYARARAEEPVFWSPRMKAWVVTRYEDISAVLRDNETFSNANSIRTISDPPPQVFQEFAVLGYPPTTPGLINSDGEQHRRIRAPFARNFAVDRVNAAQDFIRARAEARVDAIADAGHADLMSALIRPLPVEVVTFMYRLEELAPEMVAAGTRGFLALQGNLALTPVEEQVQATRDLVELARVIGEVVERRRREPRADDLATAFLRSVAPDLRELTLEEEALLVINLTGMLLPGHETTRGQLGLGVLHLLEHRDQWELLCQNPQMIPQAVEEICRYDPAVPGMFRVTTRKTEVGGVPMDPGTEVFLAFLSANRDEALCDRPDTFDVTREPTRHLAFGRGAHVCIGAETGRREIHIALEVLTRRLPGLRLAGRPIMIDPIFVTRGPLELHVEW